MTFFVYRSNERAFLVKNLINPIDEILNRSKTSLIYPKGGGLYFFYDINNIILYIGQTEQYRYRFASHYKFLFICKDIHRVELKFLKDTKKTRVEKEQNLIRQFMPKYNGLFHFKNKINKYKQFLEKYGYKVEKINEKTNTPK